jgi:hypothetical protein
MIAMENLAVQSKGTRKTILGKSFSWLLLLFPSHSCVRSLARLILGEEDQFGEDSGTSLSPTYISSFNTPYVQLN